MIPLQIATWLGVLAGLFFLGAIGTIVTPKDVSQHVPTHVSTPEEIVENAQSGYQLDTSVRGISSRTVLSDQVSRSPQLVVLEGASVTECFPGLTEFLGRESDEERGEGREDVKKDSSGLNIRTSVTVLPPATPRLSTTSTKALVEIFPTPTTTTPVLATSSSSPTVSPVIPSGGGSSGGVSTPILTEDRFDTCRVRLFGDSVPANLSDDEALAFELCLLEEVSAE